MEKNDTINLRKEIEYILNLNKVDKKFIQYLTVDNAIGNSTAFSLFEADLVLKDSLHSLNIAEYSL